MSKMVPVREKELRWLWRVEAAARDYTEAQPGLNYEESVALEEVLDQRPGTGPASLASYRAEARDFLTKMRVHPLDLGPGNHTTLEFTLGALLQRFELTSADIPVVEPTLVPVTGGEKI